MTDETQFDLSACRHWQKSAALGTAWLGIIPAWNAVTALNPAAADIWDLLIETGEVGAAAARYARAWPDRADVAVKDVTTCLIAWERQGLLHAPEPSPEQRQIANMAAMPAPPPGAAGFRRTVSVAEVAVTVEIADPALADVIEDLLADFPDTAAPAARKLQSTGPKGGWYLYLDGAPARLAASFVEARGQIVAELVRLAAGADSWLATAHGAVLTGPSGAVFLAGSTGAGKSTLSAGLVALGWRLLAEDLAAFDAEVRVAPMPFALSIKEGAVAVLRDAFAQLARARAHQLGPRRVRYQGLPARSRATRAERPRLIVDVAYTPDLAPEDVVLSRLSPIEAFDLFMNEESFIDFAHDNARGFLDFVEQTPAYEIRYGSISAAERALRERLDWHTDADRK